MNEALQDFNRLYEVVKSCYQCGSCTARCPIFKRYVNFNPRRIVKKLLLGKFDEKIFDEQQVWQCRMCHTCSAYCPQGIDVGSVIGELKNITEEIVNDQLGKSIFIKRKATKRVF